MHGAFEAVARRCPDRVAVTAPDGTTLTYAALDQQADALAARLRACGTVPGELVGLCIDRSAELLVGMLAILKSGGAYVPLDPAYPAARTEYLLADTKVRTVVAVSGTASVLQGREVRIVLADDDRTGGPNDARAGGSTPAGGGTLGEGGTSSGGGTSAAGGEGAAPAGRTVGSGMLTASSPAYVIHTSGSTGEPKGVVVEHRNAVRLMHSTTDLFAFDAEDVWTLFHSVSFDFSVWEIWGALLHGGRLVVVPDEAVRSPERLLELLERERVTVLNQTPTAFRALADCESARPAPAELALRLVVFGGERLDVAMLGPWMQRHGDDRPRLVNMYGITETTVHVTHRRIRTADLDHPGDSPVGVPLPGVRVRLVDADGAVVPPGTPGEIQVAGSGVARGYLGQEGLTAERFPEGPEGRWYRSGDRAVARADGELLHLGRIDDQIKVRGYRIEPGEVEHCLTGHPGVSAAVVTARDFEGDTRLVAYVLPAAGAVTADLPGELSARVRDRLPAHLRPAVYRLLARLPRTPQGKTDRAALDECLLESAAGPAEPAVAEGSADGSGDAAGDAAREAAVRRVVEQVLERADLGADEDVFAAGATSLSFVRILAELSREFGVAVDIAALGDTASIRRLAAAVAPAPLTTSEGDPA